MEINVVATARVNSPCPLVRLLIDEETSEVALAQDALVDEGLQRVEKVSCVGDAIGWPVVCG